MCSWDEISQLVSIQTEREVAPPLPNGGAVGIDMGVARFAALSDGSYITPFKSFRRHETALRKAQQAMSRKTQFSNNGKTATARIKHHHTRIGNACRYFLHKSTATISQNHSMVRFECALWCYGVRLMAVEPSQVMCRAPVKGIAEPM